MLRNCPNIDGFCAVALVSVVLFHLGVQTISGGFSGIDDLSGGNRSFFKLEHQ